MLRRKSKARGTGGAKVGGGSVIQKGITNRYVRQKPEGMEASQVTAGTENSQRETIMSKTLRQNCG